MGRKFNPDANIAFAMGENMYDEQDQWVIWNAKYGIVDTVAIKRVDVTPHAREAWLDEPYDMVRPLHSKSNNKLPILGH